MGKYLKQGFVRELEWQLNREEPQTNWDRFYL